MDHGKGKKNIFILPRRSTYSLSKLFYCVIQLFSGWISRLTHKLVHVIITQKPYLVITWKSCYFCFLPESTRLVKWAAIPLECCPQKGFLYFPATVERMLGCFIATADTSSVSWEVLGPTWFQETLSFVWGSHVLRVCDLGWQLMDCKVAKDPGPSETSVDFQVFFVYGLEDIHVLLWWDVKQYVPE